MEKTYWLLIKDDGAAAVAGFGEEPPNVTPMNGARLVSCMELCAVPLIVRGVRVLLEQMSTECLQSAYTEGKSYKAGIFAGRSDGFSASAEILSAALDPGLVDRAEAYNERHRRLVALEAACQAHASELPPEVLACLTP